MEKLSMVFYVSTKKVCYQGKGYQYDGDFNEEKLAKDLVTMINNQTMIDEFIIMASNPQANQMRNYYIRHNLEKIAEAYTMVKHLVVADNIILSDKPNLTGHVLAGSDVADIRGIYYSDYITSLVMGQIDDNYRERVFSNILDKDTLSDTYLNRAFNLIKTEISEATVDKIIENHPEFLMNYYRYIDLNNFEMVKANTYKVYGKYLKTLRYTNIASIAKIGKLKMASSVTKYDNTINKHISLWNDGELTSLSGFMDIDKLVKNINKNKLNKATGPILTALTTLAGDQFPWASLDSDVMEKYFPKGLSVGTYTYEGKIKETSPSELSDIVNSFNGNHTTFFMALGLENDPDKLDHLYQACAHAIKRSYSDNAFANGVNSVDYYIKRFGMFANYFEEGLLEQRMNKVMEYTIFILEADNNKSQYKRFLNWYYYAQIDKICTVQFSKTLKRMSMERKLA